MPNTKEVKSVARQLKLSRPSKDDLSVNQWKQCVVAVAIGFAEELGDKFYQHEFFTDAAYGSIQPARKQTKKK